MWDNASGADWKFKATNAGGFKIRDNIYSLDVMTFEANSVANALYLNAAGKLGIQTATPTSNLHVANIAGTKLAAFGDDVGAYTGGANVSIGDNTSDAVIYVGQTSNYKGYLVWEYNSTPADGYFEIGTYNGDNALVLQPVGGNTGIGTTTPQSLFEIKINDDNYTRFGYTAPRPNYVYQRQLLADGDGQSGVYSYRDRVAGSPNPGTGYDFNGSNTAIEGVSYWGDTLSFGTAGWNYNDYGRSGGVLGANYFGGYWGSLGYKNSGGNLYGVYASAAGWGTGGGKAGQQAMTNIGLGSWGDLFGAEIHGQVYGIYTEGANYAIFSHGTTYKDNLDVHLQDKGNGENAVLYTYVATDVCVQTCGTATLSSGKASVSFDPSFSAIVSNKEPIVITVTPVGESNGVFVTNASATGFSVSENNAGKSNVTVNYIAIGKRAGYEKPQLASEVVQSGYTDKIARGLSNDGDLNAKGEGLYYENGQLVVGLHPSLLPDPNKPVSPEFDPREHMTDKALQNEGIEDSPAGKKRVD
jgi:hypothetical protein